jgi:hypothetical protein
MATRLRFAVVLSMLLSIPVAAQESLSTLRGTVTDQSGAVVPGVTVNVDEIDTNIRARSVISDNQGNYEMPGLKQGRYRLSASMPGFKTFVANDLILASSQVRRVDIGLQLGTADTEVLVTASKSVIETEQGKVASEFTGERYRDIPIPGNAYGGTYAILATLANVQSRGGSRPIFAGQPVGQTHMGMDGVKEETANTQTVNMEHVEELKLVTINNTAEYARVGYFDTVTKRGNNQYHGEASYYHRNSALGARSTFEGTKTRDLYHTFNLAGSGPVFKNKTFFYGLWNGERVPGQSFRTRNVPTPEMRGGDFSYLLTQARPVTLIDPLTGQAFAGNKIPSSRFSPLSLKLQDYFPLPNRGTPGTPVNNFGWAHPYPTDQYRADVIVARVDHQFGKKDSLYGRFNAYLPRYVLPGNYPALASTRLRQSHSWAAVETHLFSPNLVNTFTFGGNRDGIIDGQVVDGYEAVNGDKVVSNIGLQGVNPKSLSSRGGGFPSTTIAGFSTLTVTFGGPFNDRNFSFADSVNWARGKHVVKVGGELRTYRNYNGRVVDGVYGNFNFDGSLTGNAYADFLLGLPQSSLRLDPLIDRVQRSKELGLFVTDTFKVNGRLTLDYGLRWDYFTATTFDDGLMFNWDPTANAVMVPDDVRSKVSPLYPTNIKLVTGNVVPASDKGNFAPRIGVALRLRDRTVLRGGYGIYNEFLGKFVRALTGGPFQISETYFNSISSGRATLQFPNPFPTAGASATVPSQSITGYPLETTNGFIHQFNVTLEQELRSVGFRFSYIGSRDRDLNYNLGINKPQPSLTAFSAARRPYQPFVGATFAQTDGATNYDSLTFEVRRNVGWVIFDSHYTWSNNMSNFLNLENPYDHLFWNRDFTARHRIVLNTLFELPFGHGRRYLASSPGVVNHVLGGWKVAWLAYFQTGQYFSPSFSGADPSNTNTSGGLPDRISDGNLDPGDRLLSRWFDATSFARPVTGRFGNSGVNVLQGPGLHNHNISISKRFAIGERLHLDYMTMFSNLANHPNYDFPTSNITVAGPGTITTQQGFFSNEKAGPRMIEMRLRLEF